MAETFTHETRRIWGERWRLLRAVVGKVPRFGLVILLFIGIIGGLHLPEWLRRRVDVSAVAAESGNLGLILKNDEQPQVSHSGSRLLYCQSSEKGVGVFLSNLKNGERRMIFEEMEICFGLGPHGVLMSLPWAPEDSWFAFAHQGPGAVDSEQDVTEMTLLTICEGDYGGEVATLTVPFGRVEALVWLERNAFVYASGPGGRDFHLVRHQRDGTWSQTRLTRPAIEEDRAENRFFSMIASGTNTVVWLQDNALWRMSVSEDKVEKLCDMSTPMRRFFTAIDFAPATGRLLLSCLETNGDSLWSMPLNDPSQLSRIASDVHTHDRSWSDAKWINDGKGFAFLRWAQRVPPALVLQREVNAKAENLFKQQTLQYFTPSPDGQRLFIVGDIAGQPGSGIWEYEIASSKIHPIVPASEKPLSTLQHVRGEFATLRLSPTNHLGLVVFRPVNLNRQHPGKHPVVVVNTAYKSAQPYMAQYGEAFANAGAYFIAIDRGQWHRFQNWGQNVKGLVEHLRNVPGMDLDRVFIASNSAESRYLTELLKEEPGLARGAILFVPGELPTWEGIASDERMPKLLITTQDRRGADDGYLKKYQEDCLKLGIRVDYIVHPGTPHEFIAKQSQRDRIRVMLDFVFAN